MLNRPYLSLTAGALLTAALAGAFAEVTDSGMQQRLTAEARAAVAASGAHGVTARFRAADGSPSRHALLVGGGGLDEGTRARVALAVGQVPGVGGVMWADGSARAEAGERQVVPMRCQDDVEALLLARTIRFEESKSTIDPGSQELLDEVATALRPCLGSIIAIIGHTDNSGSEPGNLALSQERAEAVMAALLRRGIPADGLRARGVGSADPIEGFSPSDPANRRIEFSVIATRTIEPTPVDTPGPR